MWKVPVIVASTLAVLLFYQNCNPGEDLTPVEDPLVTKLDGQVRTLSDLADAERVALCFYSKYQPTYLVQFLRCFL